MQKLGTNNIKDPLTLARDLEEIREDARIGRDMNYLQIIQDLLECLREGADLKYCDGCNRHHERADMRGDYCEQCTIASQHQRASDDHDYNTRND